MVVELTRLVNTILAGRGEDTVLSTEKVGWKLRSLGLPTQAIGRDGKGLQLLDPIKKRIHELAEVYCVRSLQGDSAARCRRCKAPDSQRVDREGKN
jgi:hypothetical protein